MTSPRADEPLESFDVRAGATSLVRKTVAEGDGVTGADFEGVAAGGSAAMDFAASFAEGLEVVVGFATGSTRPVVELLRSAEALLEVAGTEEAAVLPVVNSR